MGRRSVNGFLLLDKPIGLSSNAALQAVKNIYNARKAGHAGSIDPIASGMLLLCFGEYTKFAQFLLDADKQYTVTGKLGERTETGDTEGEVIAKKPVNIINADIVEAVLQQFRGDITQIPSMYSAIKHEGQPLYKLARQGIVVERKPRPLTIHDLSMLDFSPESISLSVHCSKGTYIRNLVEDIGEALGCGAHVTTLRRTAIGGLTEDKMLTLAQLKQWHNEKDWTVLNQQLLTIDCLNVFFPEVELTESMTFYMKQGQAVLVPGAPKSGFVLLKHHLGNYIGVGLILDDGRVGPKRLLAKSVE